MPELKRFTHTDADGDTFALSRHGMVKIVAAGFGRSLGVNLTPAALRELATAAVAVADELEARKAWTP